MAVRRSLVTALVLLGLLQTSGGTGTAEVRFVKYTGDGDGSNGHCCDGRWVLCPGACEHKFTICVGHSGSSTSFNDCPYFRAVTSTYEQDTNVNIFYGNIGGIPNPIRFPVSSFQRGLRVKVQVYDVDDVNSHDHVDDLHLLIQVTAARNAASATFRNLVMRSRTWMDVQYRAYCDRDYYSNTCDVYCKARDDNSGHYTCDPETGNHVCLPGWTGANCDEDINECANSPCHHAATCLNSNGAFSCLCAPAFAGPLCDVPFSSCESDPCFNGATCVDTNLTHICVCTPDWKGVLCETAVTLCDSQPCRNAANCTGDKTDYNCTCDIEWRGDNCSISTVVDFTGDPVSVLLEGNITDANRDELHHGLRNLVHETLNVSSTSRVFVKETVIVRNDWAPTAVTEVQFVAATNLGHDVFSKNHTLTALRNETVVEHHLPLPIFHPPERANAVVKDREPDKAWGSHNWYIPFAVILVILVVVVIVGYLIFTRRKREKALLQEPTISVNTSGQSNMAFENILYANSSGHATPDVIAAEQNAQNEANSHCVPVEYSTPTFRAPVPPSQLEGAVGGAEGGYQEIDPVKLKAKQLEADRFNPNFSFTNTKTDYLRPCLTMEENSYQDFRDIAGSPGGAGGAGQSEENPYMEVNHPIRIGKDYQVDERALAELCASDDDNDTFKGPRAAAAVPDLPARPPHMLSSSSLPEKEKEKDEDEDEEWTSPDFEELRAEIMAEKREQSNA